MTDARSPYFRGYRSILLATLGPVLAVLALLVPLSAMRADAQSQLAPPTALTHQETTESDPFADATTPAQWRIIQSILAQDGFQADAQRSPSRRAGIDNMLDQAKLWQAPFTPAAAQPKPQQATASSAGASFSQVAKLEPIIPYQGLSVAFDGNTIAVGALGAGILYTRENGLASTITPVGYLHAGSSSSDYFGLSLAVSGDTIVVGDPGYGGNAGSAYVFEKGSGWTPDSETGAITPTAALRLSTPVSETYFGASVAMDGDTIIVGTVYGGAAYVFEKGSGWSGTMTEIATLQATGVTSSSLFGFSVAIDGDTVVVGAPEIDSGQGAAYLFEKGAAWTGAMAETAKLMPSDGYTETGLGVSVDLYLDTVVAGAADADMGQGVAYLFEKGGGWTATVTETAKFTASDGAAGDTFGIDVSIAPDILAVGAFQAMSNAGAVYLFEKGIGWTGQLTESAKLMASDAQDDAYFGLSVATNGAELFVGSPGAWSAYAFAKDCVTQSSENWEQISTWDCGHMPNGEEPVAISSGHTVSLTANVTQTGPIKLYGILDTDGYTLTLGATATITGDGDIVGATSRVGPATGTALFFNNSGTTINFSTAPSQMDVTLTKGSHPNANAAGGGSAMLPRYYTLSPTGATTAEVCLGYQDSEMGGINEANLRLCRWNAGTSQWNCPVRSASSSTISNTVCAENISEFSDWVMGAVGPTAVTQQSLTVRGLVAHTLPALSAALAVLLCAWAVLACRPRHSSPRQSCLVSSVTTSIERMDSGRKAYESPRITHELHLESRAGSILDAPIDMLDPLNEWILE